jgi:hypothetical protein
MAGLTKNITLKIRRMLWLTGIVVILAILLLPYFVKILLGIIILALGAGLVYYWLTLLCNYFEDN